MAEAAATLIDTGVAGAAKGVLVEGAAETAEDGGDSEEPAGAQLVRMCVEGTAKSTERDLLLIRRMCWLLLVGMTALL